jgi:hypothetical protein
MEDSPHRDGLIMTKVLTRSGRDTKRAAGESVCGNAEGQAPVGKPAEGCEGEEQRCRMIAEAAYFRALERQFAPGQDVDDWLQAEKDVDTTLLRSSGG